MNQFDELRKKNTEACQSAQSTVNHLAQIADESYRVAAVAHNAGEILSDIDRAFADKTKLDKLDIAFLFFATALQCARQYLLTSFPQRENDQKSADKVKGDNAEHSDRTHRLYNPSLAEIVTNPVPFDALFGGGNFDLGLSGITHRAKTLGHDPLLGWIFGTANIATSTMTMWNGQSYHVKTGQISTGAARDKITNHASTGKVFYYTEEKLLHSGIEGKKIIGCALLKEAIHLRSDIYSTAGIPIPIISSISPDFALQLSSFGIDMGNVLVVAKQGAYAVMINSLIAMLHGLFFGLSKSENIELYKVKTRKILSYSNMLASTSNVIYVALTKDISKLDIGGILVTLYRMISDYHFIQQIKSEFLISEFSNIISGEAYNF